METPARDPRVRKISLRLSEKEYLQLLTQMQSNDYRSLSRFIRDKLLDTKTVIRKNVVLTDRNLRNQINALSSNVARIGVDYNQATKKFNSLCKEKRADGSPVINARAANYYLRQVSVMTKELKEAMDKVIHLVSQIDYDRRPRGEADNNQ